MFSEIYKYIWSTEAAALPLKNCSNGSRTESKTEMLKCWCIISEHWCKRWLDVSSIMTHCCNSANVKTLVVSRCSVYLYRDYIRCCWTHLSILYHKHTQTCACVNTHKHTPTLSLSLIWNNPRSPFNASQPPPLFIHLPLCCCSSLILSAFKITTEGRRQPPLSIQPPLWQTAAAFSQMLGLNTQIDRQIDR